MLELSLADWLAISSLLALIAARVFTEVQAYLVARHDAGLARIVGMAQRAAASVARTLVTDQSTASMPDLERKLVQAATGSILNEMMQSVAVTGATADKVSGIVQAEVDKLLVVAPVPTPPKSGLTP
jgi:hypothetical protein